MLNGDKIMLGGCFTIVVAVLCVVMMSYAILDKEEKKELAKERIVELSESTKGNEKATSMLIVALSDTILTEHEYKMIIGELK